MSNIVETARPRHGDQKNWRMETAVSSTTTFNLPDGEELELVSHSSEHSVSERFCTPCDKWVTAEGVLGGVWCPECNTQWNKQ